MFQYENGGAIKGIAAKVSAGNAVLMRVSVNFLAKARQMLT